MSANRSTIAEARALIRPGVTVEARVYKQIWATSKVTAAGLDGFEAEDDDGGLHSLCYEDVGKDWRWPTV